jgi:hypothetical protein
MEMGRRKQQNNGKKSGGRKGRKNLGEKGMSENVSLVSGLLAVFSRLLASTLGPLSSVVTYLSLRIWSSLYTGLLSSNPFARPHSPLPMALLSFLANALCSLSFARTGSWRRYWMSFW